MLRMGDEPKPAAPAAEAPKPAVEVAPPAVEPKPAPVQAAPEAPKPAPEAEKPAEKPAEAAPEAKPEAKADGLKPHTEEPTLLEGEAKKPEIKTEPKAEAKPGEKPAEAKAGEKPADAPKVVYELKAPEGYPEFDAKMLEPAVELFTKHNIQPEVAQELMGLHATQMKSFAEELGKQTLANQHKTFADTRAMWRKEIQTDPVYGGAGYETTMRAGKRMINLFVPDSEMQSFNDFMRLTGAGDHPAFIKFLARMSRRYDEAAPAPKPAGAAPDRGKPSGRAGRRQTLYDHPTSHRGNGVA